MSTERLRKVELIGGMLPQRCLPAAYLPVCACMRGNGLVAGGVWRTVKSIRVPGTLLLTLLVSGCAYLYGGNPGGSTGPSPAGPTANLLNGSWVLTDGTGPSGAIQVFDDHRITLVIDGNRAGGHSACNIYGGTVTIDGAALRLSAMSMTEMACADDGPMDSEAAYLAALGSVTRWERVGDRLTLSGEATQLNFQLEPPVPDEEIVGASWVLESLLQGDAATSVLGEATLTLAADGTFTGSTGCRGLRGRYVVFGDEIDFTELAAEGECAADQRGQDAFVIDVLEGGFSATVDGATLTVSDNAGHGLVYRAAPGIE